jgi:hypothetical protein
MFSRERIARESGGNMMQVRTLAVGAGHSARWLGALVVAAGVWSPVSTSLAATDVGEAVLVVSAVRGTLGTETREIAVKDDVYAQEVIETGEDAATRLVFLDGTELSIGPSSRVTIDRYIYDPSNKGAGQLTMNLLSGVFEFASGDIPSTGYDLRTPFATIAVRGTRINVVVRDEFLVRVKEGGVNVNAPGQSIPIGELFCFTVPSIAGDVADGEVLNPDDCEPRLGSILAMEALFAGAIQPAGLLGVNPLLQEGFEGDQGDREGGNDFPGLNGSAQ